MKNNFIKSENFTKWAIRKVSVGVVSAAIASGIFVIVGGGEAHASDKQLDKAQVVETVKPQVDENIVTKPTKKAESVETTTVKTKEADKIGEQPVVGTNREAKTEVTENNILSLAKDTADAPKIEASDMTTHKTTPVEVKKAVMDDTKNIEIVAEIKDQLLSISIIDEGCGIKEEEIDNIFKRLYRVEASRNMKTGGYGLGLAIAKQLALQINGDIIVKSEYGKGSKFTLKINC